jgi:lysophospholipase L1-like esterase
MVLRFRTLLLSTIGVTLAGVLTACGTPSTAGVNPSLPPTSVRASSVATQPTTAKTVQPPEKTSTPPVAGPALSPAQARAKKHRLTVQAARKGVLGLGDSVLLGSKPLFAAHGWRVDAQVSRQFSMGVSVLRRYAGSRATPRNVVVALGTNGTVSPTDCRAMVRAAGTSRRVFFVNNHAARSWTASNNRAIRGCAASFSNNRAIVVDWATAAAAHPGWFGADGIHPNASGRRQYMGLIESAVARWGI